MPMKKKVESSFSNTLLISLCIAGGFVCSYFYEIAFLTYFGLPVRTIEITVPSVIYYILILMIIMFSFAYLFKYLRPSAVAERTIARAWLKTFFFLFPLAYVTFVLGPSGQRYWIFLGFILVLMYIEWSVPVASLFKGGLRRKHVFLVDMVAGDHLRFMHKARTFMDNTNHLIVVLLIIFVSVSYFHGLAAAKQQKEKFIGKRITEPAQILRSKTPR